MFTTWLTRQCLTSTTWQATGSKILLSSKQTFIIIALNNVCVCVCVCVRFVEGGVWGTAVCSLYLNTLSYFSCTWNGITCTEEDFDSVYNTNGICYTFNSGRTAQIRHSTETGRVCVCVCLCVCVYVFMRVCVCVCVKRILRKPDIDKPTSWHPTKIYLERNIDHCKYLFIPEA